MIMGDKMYVNFAKYPYDECLKRLQRELSRIQKPEKSISRKRSSSMKKLRQFAENSSPDKSESATRNENRKVEEWTEQV